MKEGSEKTEKKQKRRGAPPEYLFKPGQSGNPKGRPKGKRNFETDFKEAAKEIAKALRLGNKPDLIYIKLMQAGIKSGLKGNYNFWRDIIDRLYGKELGKLEIDKPLVITPEIAKKYGINIDTGPEDNSE